MPQSSCVRVTLLFQDFDRVAQNVNFSNLPQIALKCQIYHRFSNPNHLVPFSLQVVDKTIDKTKLGRDRISIDTKWSPHPGLASSHLRAAGGRTPAITHAISSIFLARSHPYPSLPKHLEPLSKLKPSCLHSPSFHSLPTLSDLRLLGPRTMCTQRRQGSMRSRAACARPFAPASWWRLGKTRSGRDASVRVSASLRWDPSLTRDGDPTGGDDRECEPGLREEPVCLGPETQDGEHPRLKSSLPECAH
jgi:hypothetical protein